MKGLVIKSSLLIIYGAVIIIGLPSTAMAHLVTTGMGPVYDGIGHMLLTPEDLVPVLALALYSGMLGVAAGRRVMVLLPLAWLFGGLAGGFSEISSPAVLPSIVFLTLGLLIAIDVTLPLLGFSLVTILVGLVHGFFNGVALREGVSALGLVGITVALFVIVIVVSAFVVSLERPWVRIVMRVFGSWIAAIGLLMVGWLIRGHS